MCRHIFIISLLLILLTACNGNTSADLPPSYDGVRILFATDLHYLSPKLYDDNEAFRAFIDGGDGKLTYYSEEITDAFIQDVLDEHPNALLLGGDLSFNGELESHKGLAEKLSKVSDAGIPVLVVPGNHDINRPNAYSYKDNVYEKTENISPKEFWNLYSALGAENALSFDKNSLSYVYALSSDIRLLMLDTCKYQEGAVSHAGEISDATFAWIKECLSDAKKTGALVISVTHHNVLTHSGMFPNYTIFNNQRVIDLFKEYNVPLNLSGHIHIQSITDDGGELFDAATNSLSVYNNRYASITIGDKIIYQTHHTDVEKWAKNIKSDNPNLLNFNEYSSERFDGFTGDRLAELLASHELTAEQRDSMLDLAVRFNRYFFGGNLYEVKEELENDPAFKLWETEFPEGFFLDYMSFVLSEEARDCNYLEIELK